MTTPFCEATHSELVTGVCPWCGAELRDGRALPTRTKYEELGRLALVTAAPRDILDPMVNLLLPGVVRLLKHKDSDLRRAAARTLGNIGPKADAALPELGQLLNDAEPDVREAAKNAIEQISG